MMSTLTFVLLFYRGVKHTLWEGGVRGDGFIWSPLLKNSSRVSHQMVHITDWLLTVLSAAGYDTSKLSNHSLDGIDQWKELSQNLPAKRTEMIHNIDPKDAKVPYALRSGDYKIIYCSNGWDGWYPPEGVDLGGNIINIYMFE